MLEMVGVGFKFKDVVLHDFDLKVIPSKLSILVGTNESVLSTIIHAACGQIPLEDGNVIIDGESIKSETNRNSIVAVLDVPYMTNTLTPRQNLEYYLRLRNISFASNDLEGIANQLLIHEFLDTEVSLLGKGTVREFEILEAIIIRPRYLIISDFTCHFSQTYFKRIIPLFGRLIEEGVSVFSSTPSFKLATSLGNHLPVRILYLEENGTNGS